MTTRGSIRTSVATRHLCLSLTGSWLLLFCARTETIGEEPDMHKTLDTEYFFLGFGKHPSH